MPINQKDMSPIIGYNEKVSLILDNIWIDENEEIKNICLSTLNPYEVI